MAEVANVGLAGPNGDPPSKVKLEDYSDSPIEDTTDDQTKNSSETMLFDTDAVIGPGFLIDHQKFDFGSASIEVERGGKLQKFLELLTRHDQDLRDPSTGRQYSSTVRQLERLASEAMDELAWKQSVFLSLVDRIEAYKEEAEGRGLDKLSDAAKTALTEHEMQAREEILDFDMRDLMREAKLAFKESEVAKQYADDLEVSYNALCKSRISRLQDAKALINERDVKTWPQADGMVAPINQEIRELQSGIRPSDWFRVQHLFAEKTGRLLFSPYQVSRAGEHVGEDRWHRGPIKGTVDEIVSMLTVYVDGMASVKRSVSLY